MHSVDLGNFNTIQPDEKSTARGGQSCGYDRIEMLHIC